MAAEDEYTDWMRIRINLYEESKARHLECRLLGGCTFVHENTLFEGLFEPTECITSHRELCPNCGGYRIVSHGHSPGNTYIRYHPGPDGRMREYWQREIHLAKLGIDDTMPR